MAQQTKFIFVTGGVVSLARQGPGLGVDRRLLENRGLKVTIHEAGPVHQRRSGHDEPDAARRGVRHRRRRRDRSRPRPLRALHLARGCRRLNNFTTGQIYQTVIQKERRGEYLGGDRAGDSAHHRRDQGAHPRLRRGRRRPHRRGRRHRRRHRVAAVPRGDPPAAHRARRRRTSVSRPPDAGAVHRAPPASSRPSRRSTRCRSCARSASSPTSSSAAASGRSSRALKKKIALFSNVAADAVFTVEDVDAHLRGAARASTSEGARREDLPSCSTSGRARPSSTGVGAHRRAGQRARKREVDDRHRRQVRRPRRALQEPQRGAGPRRHRQRLPRRPSSTSTPRRSRSAAPTRCCADVDGILVAPGFGARGTEGKIAAVRYAREKQVPFFGICFGMQMAVRRVRAQRRAASTAPTRPSSIRRRRTRSSTSCPSSATSPTRARRCASAPIPACSSPAPRAAEAYGATEISERHRHRYEVNNDYRDALEQHGLVLSGPVARRRLVEMIELPEHPYFVGCQFHPEFKSRPQAPHPLFRRFIARRARAARLRRPPPTAEPSDAAAGRTPAVSRNSRRRPSRSRARCARRRPASAVLTEYCTTQRSFAFTLSVPAAYVYDVS